MTKEALDYAEEQAARNAEFHLQNIVSLQREAHVTLTILIAAIPAAFVYALKLCSTGMWTWAIGLFGLSLYLCGVAVRLSLAIKPRPISAPANEPQSLLPALNDQNYTLEEIREHELKNLQVRIDANRIRCEETGALIHKTRQAILKSPFVYMGAELLVLFVRWTLTF